MLELFDTLHKFIKSDEGFRKRDENMPVKILTGIFSLIASLGEQVQELLDLSHT